jgi:hypothetical protein
VNGIAAKTNNTNANTNKRRCRFISISHTTGLTVGGNAASACATPTATALANNAGWAAKRLITDVRRDSNKVGFFSMYPKIAVKIAVKFTFGAPIL